MLCGGVIFFEKRGLRAIGIEHEALLIGSIQPALEQSFDKLCRVVGAEQPRTEHRHLAFEHLVEMRDAGFALADQIENVVRVEEAVGPSIGANRVVEVFPGDVEQFDRVARGYRSDAGKSTAVHCITIVAKGVAEQIEKLPLPSI